MIERRIDVVGKLNFSNWSSAGCGEADRETNNSLFAKRCVEHTLVTFTRQSNVSQVTINYKLVQIGFKNTTRMPLDPKMRIWKKT